MKKILRSHPNAIITALVLVFLGILAALYAWAINDIILYTHEALSSVSGGSESGFDLTAASNLDLRGLLNGVPLAPAVTTTPTTTVVATTTTTVTSTATTSASGASR